MNRGYARQALGQEREAIADYREAIRIQPELAKTFYDSGKEKVGFGHIIGARPDFETALELAEHAGNQSLKVEIQRTLQELENTE